MQEVSLKTPYIRSHLLCTWSSIRHLDLETHIPDLLQHVDMRAFTQLETLRLRSCSMIPPSINDMNLDLSHVRSLTHLHIVNWAPKKINVKPGCRVYSKWESPHTLPYVDISKNRLPWVLSPCWTDSSSKLVSFHINQRTLSASGHRTLHAFRTMMEFCEGLESFRCALVTLGSKKLPIVFPASPLRGPRAPLIVEIITSGGCWLQVDDMTCLGKGTVLKTEGPLHVGILAASGRMLWCSLKGSSLSTIGIGPESLQQQLAEAICEDYNLNAEPPQDHGAPCPLAACACGSCTHIFKYMLAILMALCVVGILTFVCI